MTYYILAQSSAPEAAVAAPRIHDAVQDPRDPGLTRVHANHPTIASPDQGPDRHSTADIGAQGHGEGED